MFRSMPFILLVIIISILLLDSFIPYGVKQFLYSISLTIKSIIVTILPIIIFGLLFKAAITLSNKASKIIGLILLLVCVSNFTSTFLSHYIGIWVHHFDLSIVIPQDSTDLVPLWIIHFPKLIENSHAMFSGIILGLVLAKIQPKFAQNLANQLNKYINLILKIIVYLIPVFVAGFIIKLKFDDTIGIIIKDYSSIFMIIAAAQFIYILFTYFLLNNCKIKTSLVSVKNMLPAAISGFSTMSSAASMPLSIIGAENNAKDKDLANSVIPATVNIHLIGDCFAIPIFAYAVLKSFGMEDPSLFNYLVFTFYFVLAKFSVAAIPGGGIIVMLPILEAYLGFNADMMSLITALYILFDPVITCANVLGNGAFAKMTDRIVTKN